MAKRKKKRQTLKTFLTGKLRSASLLWPARQDVYDRIRVERGKYKCEICEEIFKRKEIDIDHVEPVIDIQIGFIDWNTYIENLFCEADNLQGICKSCHSVKTEQEKEMRMFYKQKLKEKEEKPKRKRGRPKKETEE